MTPQETASGVYAAINAVQRILSREGVAKSRSNSQQNYKFRGIDDIYNALSPLLSEHGLCILPRYTSRCSEERPTKTGGVLFYVVMEAEFDIVAVADGSMHMVRTFGEAMDSADKATNKAMSAAYKAMAIQLFAIPTEGDNDADQVTHSPRAERQTGTQPGSQRGGSSDPAPASRAEGAGPVTTPSVESDYRLSELLRVASKSPEDAQGVLVDLCEAIREAGGDKLADGAWTKACNRFGDPATKPSATDPVIRALYAAKEAAQFAGEVNAA